MDKMANYKKHIFNIFLVISLGFTALAGRLIYINQVKSQTYIAMAQSLHLETIAEIEFERGDFLDRYGRSLTSNSENVLVSFDSLEPEIIERNIDIANFDIDDYTSDLDEQLENLYLLNLQPRYSQTSLAVHTIGYVGVANFSEAQTLAQNGIDSTYIGKSGLELQYDSVLQGKSSAQIGVPTDQFGEIMGDLRYLPAGESTNLNVQLTLDKDYQQIAEAAMSDVNGAVVVMEVATGDILAVVSSPSYDQYEGQVETDGDVYLNKAFAYYPPASVFKLVLTLAALDNDITLDNQTSTIYDDFFCDGSITLSTGSIVNCWNSAGHGYEDLSTALANSCNPYFIALGQAVGGDLIEEYCYRLGLAEQNIIGYNVTSMADNIDFNHNVPADVANVSIGEKGIRLTPLLVAQLLATIANDGKLVTPRLVSALLDNDGFIVQSFPAKVGSQVVQESSAIALQEMLANAVENGTGSPAQSEIVSIAGKTGTSQDFGVWFAGFAPVENPQLAISVYVADGESGGTDGGTIFKEIIENIALLEAIGQ